MILVHAFKYTVYDFKICRPPMNLHEQNFQARIVDKHGPSFLQPHFFCINYIPPELKFSAFQTPYVFSYLCLGSVLIFTPHLQDAFPYLVYQRNSFYPSKIQLKSHFLWKYLLLFLGNQYYLLKACLYLKWNFKNCAIFVHLLFYCFMEKSQQTSCKGMNYKQC